MKVIALAGVKGSGKDTVGKIIQDLYPNYPCHTIAFADPIKKQIQHIFQLLPNNNEEYDFFKRGMVATQVSAGRYHYVPGRRVVREIGMLMRQYDEKQFVKYVTDRIETAPNDVWIITDLRFDNEYTMLKSIGAKIIKIVRPNHQYDGHITERTFDDHLVDEVLTNDGDLSVLRAQVQFITSRFFEEWK